MLISWAVAGGISFFCCDWGAVASWAQAAEEYASAPANARPTMRFRQRKEWWRDFIGARNILTRLECVRLAGRGGFVAVEKAERLKAAAGNGCYLIATARVSRWRAIRVRRYGPICAADSKPADLAAASASAGERPRLARSASGSRS